MTNGKQETANYTHGHHASVLRSHTWRTAQNSAAFLLPHLKEGQSVLDCGCGPGTITADLADLVGPGGSVVGLEYAPEVLKEAEAYATSRGITNLTFKTGDIHNLPFGDATFDVVFAHQVLQHVGDPIQALREMRRVTKKGGIVAARDSDYEAFTFFPPSAVLDRWKQLYLKVARKNGGEPNAGRMLHSFARSAGFQSSTVDKGCSTWCFATKEDIAWWSGLWSERTLKSNFASTATSQGVSQEELEEISTAWTKWGEEEDAWFMVPHGEIISHV